MAVTKSIKCSNEHHNRKECFQN